jgi:hypothetical protein
MDCASPVGTADTLCGDLSAMDGQCSVDARPIGSKISEFGTTPSFIFTQSMMMPILYQHWQPL